MERNSIVFYRSFYEAIKELNPTTKSEVYDAIMEFSFSGNEIDLSGIAKTVFILIKPQLEANMRRYENGMKPKKRITAKEKQTKSKEESNVNENDNDNANDFVKAKKFQPPLLEEVKEFFYLNGYKPEVAQNAFHYYNEANWKDSRGKAIHNWKQKMRGVWFKEENKIVTATNKAVYTPTSKYRPA